MDKPEFSWKGLKEYLQSQKEKMPKPGDKPEFTWTGFIVYMIITCIVYYFVMKPMMMKQHMGVWMFFDFFVCFIFSFCWPIMLPIVFFCWLLIQPWPF